MQARPKTAKGNLFLWGFRSFLFVSLVTIPNTIQEEVYL